MKPHLRARQDAVACSDATPSVRADLCDKNRAADQYHDASSSDDAPSRLGSQTRGILTTPSLRVRQDAVACLDAAPASVRPDVCNRNRAADQLHDASSSDDALSSRRAQEIQLMLEGLTLAAGRS